MIKRDKEVDIAVGDTRIVILIHQHAGKDFLWPVLRQWPSNSSITGILGESGRRRSHFDLFRHPLTLLVSSALQPVLYEEQQQLPKKLKINNREIGVIRWVCQTPPLKGWTVCLLMDVCVSLPAGTRQRNSA